jgi:acetyl-CoA synthetase
LSLFSVFGHEPIYQRVSKGDATILVTTSKYMKKSKTIGGATSSLRYIILTDAAEHLSTKYYLFHLMSQAPSDFKIPETNPEDAALPILPVELPVPKVLHVHHGFYPLHNRQIRP